MASTVDDVQPVANDANLVQDTPDVDLNNDKPDTLEAEADPTEVPEVPKKKREHKENAARDIGKSLLPFTRVQKIIKADKDIPIIARDATFLISLAAEEFIKRLCQAGQRAAEREKRATVQHKDLATVVRRADEFMFLDEIISITYTEAQPKRVPKALANSKANSVPTGPTLLDQFVRTTASTESQDLAMEEEETQAM